MTKTAMLTDRFKTNYLKPNTLNALGITPVGLIGAALATAAGIAFWPAFLIGASGAACGCLISYAMHLFSQKDHGNKINSFIDSAKFYAPFVLIGLAAIFVVAHFFFPPLVFGTLLLLPATISCFASNFSLSCNSYMNTPLQAQLMQSERPSSHHASTAATPKSDCTDSDHKQTLANDYVCTP